MRGLAGSFGVLRGSRDLVTRVINKVSIVVFHHNSNSGT